MIDCFVSSASGWTGSDLPEEGCHILAFLPVIRDPVQPREEDLTGDVHHVMLFNQGG